LRAWEGRGYVIQVSGRSFAQGVKAKEMINNKFKIQIILNLIFNNLK